MRSKDSLRRTIGLCFVVTFLGTMSLSLGTAHATSTPSECEQGQRETIELVAALNTYVFNAVIPAGKISWELTVDWKITWKDSTVPVTMRSTYNNSTKNIQWLFEKKVMTGCVHSVVAQPSLRWTNTMSGRGMGGDESLRWYGPWFRHDTGLSLSKHIYFCRMIMGAYPIPATGEIYNIDIRNATLQCNEKNK